MLFQLQKYRPEKHLRWSHNSSSNPNSCSGNDCHSWLMFGWTVFRHLLWWRAQNLSRYLLIYFVLFIFPPVKDFSAVESPLLYFKPITFCCLHYKGADSFISSAAQPLLVYPGVHRYNSFFSDIHYFFLNLVINGLRSSNITLSSTFCYRFQQMVHFPLHFLLFVPVSDLKSIKMRIQLVYNNRWISGFSISGPCETRWKPSQQMVSDIIHQNTGFL